jgi:hypothetical protein
MPSTIDRRRGLFVAALAPRHTAMLAMVIFLNRDNLGVVERGRTRCYLTHNTFKAKLVNLMVCDN